MIDKIQKKVDVYKRQLEEAVSCDGRRGGMIDITVASFIVQLLVTFSYSIL